MQDRPLAINDADQDTENNDPVDIFAPEAIADSMDTLWMVFKHITTSSLPMMGTATLPTQFFIFGMVLIHLSEDENTLASTALIFQMLIFMLIQLSPIFGASNVIRNQLGELQKAEDEGNTEEAEILVKSISAMPKSMMITTSCTSPVSFFPMHFSDDVLEHVYQQNSLLSQLASPFLRVYSYSVPGQSIRMPMLHLLYGFSKAIPAALMALTSLSATTVFGLALSYGWFGNAPMGRIGIAIGAVIEPYLTAAGYMVYVRFHADFARFDFLGRSNHPYIVRQLKAIARIGLPISASLIADVGSNSALGALTGVTGGREALIATSILNQLNAFMTIVRPPISHAISLELSYRVGHHEFERATNYAKKGLMVSAIYTTPIPLISSAAPDVLVFISGKSVDSMSYMRKLAPILGWSQMMEGIRMGLMNQLHAFNDNNIPAAISILSTGAGIVIGALTGIYTEGKVFALTGAYAGGITIGVAALGVRWYFTSKPQRIEQLQRQQVAIYHASSQAGTFFKCCRGRQKDAVPLLPETTTQSKATL